MASNAQRTDIRKPAARAAERRAIDAVRSRIGFRVRKMGLYLVKSCFRRAEGWVELDHDGVPQRGEIGVDARSISNRVPPRDWHLRTRDLLDVKRRPMITVTVDSAKALSGEIRAPATFTIHAVSRTVPLAGHVHAPAPAWRFTSRARSTGAPSASVRAGRWSGSSARRCGSTRSSSSPLRTTRRRAVDAPAADPDRGAPQRGGHRTRPGGRGRRHGVDDGLEQRREPAARAGAKRRAGTGVQPGARGRAA